MTQVLFIKANPKEESQSYSLTVGAAFLTAYKAANPTHDIVELDLYNVDIPLVDADVLGAWGQFSQGQTFDQLTPAQQTKVSRMNELMDQFIQADKYVFINPVWNFSIPPKLKAYIDSICIAGKTFTYTAQGPVGLLEGKKALHIQASGGAYGDNSPMDFSNKYIKVILGFIGIKEIESIAVEGLAMYPGEVDSIKATAIEKANTIALTF